MIINDICGNFRRYWNTGSKRANGMVCLFLGMLFTMMLPFPGRCDDAVFDIQGYMVEGNSILNEDETTQILQPFTGKDKTAETVNQAQKALETFYHNLGYPAVMVNIPVQTIDSGMVRLQVIESRISRIRVTGNRYFTMKRLLRSLPSIRPGSIFYLPQLEKELNRLNQNRHVKVTPMLSPGRETGTIDVELKVKDVLPLHASIELDNYSTHATTDLRNSVKFSYDNFFQRDHSLSLQIQDSPENLDEVKVAAGSYLLPSFISPDQMMALYAVWSDSNIRIVNDFNVVSKGKVFGMRYIIPFPSRDGYYHSLTLGIDYKDFDDVINQSGTSEATSDNTDDTTEETSEDTGSEDDTPHAIQYLPISMNYSASFADDWGNNQIGIGISTGVRSLVADQNEFDAKRVKARPSYMVFTSSYSRDQALADAGSLFFRLNGQLASMPLLSNEQFFAGGARSVRGYKENEAVGDTGISGSMEYRLPDMVKVLDKIVPVGQSIALCPYFFYDAAALNVKEPLPSQKSAFTLQGVGVGIRGNVTRFFNFQVDGGMPLVSTEHINSGDFQLYFKMVGEF